MRHILPLALLLCACAPLATPAPYAPAIARPEQVADAGATAAVAVAAGRPLPNSGVWKCSRTEIRLLQAMQKPAMERGVSPG